MKLYHLLVLSFFAFVSCDSSFLDENVYSFDEYYVCKGEFLHEGFEGEEYKISADLNLKFTLSEEDECVYFIFKIKELYYPTIQDHVKGTLESIKWIRPETFIVNFWDKEGNLIFRWNNIGSSKSLKDQFEIERIEPPFTYGGKATDVNGILFKPEFFRSKLERVDQITLQWHYWNGQGSGIYL